MERERGVKGRPVQRPSVDVAVAPWFPGNVINSQRRRTPNSYGWVLPGS